MQDPKIITRLKRHEHLLILTPQIHHHHRLFCPRTRRLNGATEYDAAVKGIYCWFEKLCTISGKLRLHETEMVLGRFVSLGASNLMFDLFNFLKNTHGELWEPASTLNDASDEKLRKRKRHLPTSKSLHSI